MITFRANYKHKIRWDESSSSAPGLKKSVIANFYEFIFNANQSISSFISQKSEDGEVSIISMLHAYKVTVHPKMEKSAFLK